MILATSRLVGVTITKYRFVGNHEFLTLSFGSLGLGRVVWRGNNDSDGSLAKLLLYSYSYTWWTHETLINVFGL